MDNSLLLVDDDVGILKALKRLLTRSGYSVKTAQSGEEALNLLLTYDCKVVLTDFRMPYMDGGLLLSKIKRLYPEVVGLVISGYSDFESVKSLLNAGSAYRFLQKPWEDNELLDEIANAFTHHNKQIFQRQSQKMLLASSDALLEISPSNQIVHANIAATKLLGSTLVEGRLLDEFLVETDRLTLQEQTFAIGQSVSIRLLNHTELEVSCRLAGPSGIVLCLNPVTDGELLNTAFELPSLLNYQQLISVITQYLNSSRAMVLVVIKIKSFELWSRMIGYSEAQRTIEHIALQLLNSTGTAGELALLANEQFVLCLPDITSEMDALQKAASIIDPVTGKANLTSSKLDYAVSYCLIPDDGDEPRAVLNNLLLGNLMMAEDSVRMFMRYDQQAIERKKHQISLNQALFHAVQQRQLFLHFQPKFDFAKYNLSGCEALIRWQHPEFGMVSPALFIPLAEQHGQMVDIGYWVLKTAFITAARWRSEGIQFGKMAINISGRQLTEPDFIHWIKHHIQLTGVSPTDLEFELTETFLLNNLEDCAITLKAIAELGISIAIDDFGTGYSSLSYLSKLPINVLKIDRSLVLDIESNLNTESLVANVVRLAHDLNMKVVVEGIETLDQLNIVKSLGCDVVQGYCISKPQSEEEYLALLASFESLSATMA